MKLNWIYKILLTQTKKGLKQGFYFKKQNYNIKFTTENHIQFKFIQIQAESLLTKQLSPTAAIKNLASKVIETDFTNCDFFFEVKAYLVH